MSTPATRSPIALAARTAVLRSSGVSLILLGRAAAVEVGAELARRAAWRFIAATTLPSDDEAADVRARRPP